MNEKGLAVVFPGQGSQYVGMSSGMDPGLLTAADDILGRPLGRLCAEGPAEVLNDTRNAQPAMFVADVSAWRALTSSLDVVPRFLAGHSLGEYAAYCASGVMDFDTALRLVDKRANLMAAAAGKVDGGMAAVIGLDGEQVRQTLRSGAVAVTVANFNSPVQTVVSGSLDALEGAAELLKQAGAKRFVPLAVSGPFHSQLMKEAAEGLAVDLEDVELSQPAQPVVANVLARPAAGVDEIRESLYQQICGSVLWQQSVEWMQSRGVTVFVEAGPGKVLAGLIRRIAPECSTFSTGEFDDLGLLVREIKSALGDE